MIRIRIVETGQDLARAAAAEFSRCANEAFAAGREFGVCLSGGSTPKAVYRTLADPAAPYREAIDWTRIRFWFGDERAVPPGHADSNYRMAHEALFSRIPVPSGNVVRFRSEGEDPEAVASAYESLLRDAFRLRLGERPRFDLILLGLGTDGHTASLFPGSEAIREAERLAAAPWVASLGVRRYTVTPVVLNAAARVLFLVAGAAKAEVLREVLQGGFRPDLLPAQVVRPDRGEVLWIVDREAARFLP